MQILNKTTLFLLIVGGLYAYLTRDRWIARVTGNNDSATVTWEPVVEPRAKQAESALEALQQKGGPAYVTMSAAELASLMVASTGHRLPASLDSVEAGVTGEAVRVRARVKLDDIRGLEALGPLSGVIGTSERMELTGTMAVLRPGLGEFRVASVKIGDFLLPRAAIPRLLARLDSSVRPEGVSPDGIAITIPEYIGDVRVARGEITIYKRAP